MLLYTIRYPGFVFTTNQGMEMYKNFTLPRFGLTLSIIAAFGISCAPSEVQEPFDLDAQIDSWVNLWNTYDLDLVEELFVTDSSVTYFSSEYEGVIKGIDAVRQHHVGFGFVEGGKDPEQELWVGDTDAVVHWPVAIVTGLWYFGDRLVPQDQVQRGPFTFVYVQQGEEYRLAHLNFGNYENDPSEEQE